MVSMDEICGYVRNYFLKDYVDPAKYIHKGTYTIADGSIQGLSFLVAGQWFRIVGSALNDGVYQYPAENLEDEVFDGAIWEMYVPAAFVNLVNEISEWTDVNKDVIASPYQSESFGGYSYSIKSGGYNSTIGNYDYGWQAQFSKRLSSYRRLSVI